MTRLGSIALATVLVVLGLSLSPLAEPTAEAALPTIPVGSGATDVGFSPSGAEAYVTNAIDGTVTFINTASSAVVATVPVGANPIDLAIAPDGGSIYVLLGSASDSYIKVINPATRSVVGTISAGYVARSVAITKDSKKLYVTNYNGFLKIISTSTGATTRTIEIPGSSDVTRVEISPDGLSAYVSSGETTYRPMIVINTITETFAGDTGTGPRDTILAATPDGSSAVWPVDASIYIAGTTWETLPKEIPIGGYGRAVAITPVGTHAYVAVPENDEVVVVDVPWGRVVDTIAVGDVPTRVAVSPNGQLVYVLNEGSNTLSVVVRSESVVNSDIVDRVSGADRFDTAVRISQLGYPAGADTLFIASGLNYPDALSAAPIAGVRDAPLLLTLPSGLPPVVLAEVKRLDPNTIVVAGTSPAISSTVITQLKNAVPGATVRSLGGANRFETSRILIDWHVQSASPAITSFANMYIATGLGFPDALSAAAAAGNQEVPVLLVPGTANADPAASALIRDLDVSRISITGGLPSVSNQLAYELTIATNTVNQDRFFGNDRFATSQNINGSQFDSATRVYLASGLNFPDALAGGALAAAQGAPLYVIPSNCVPQRVLNDIDRLGATSIVILGGPTTLTPGVENLVVCS